MKLKLIFLLLLLGCLMVAPLYSQSDTLTIIHINDTHSHLVPWGPKNINGEGTIGGIARVVSVIGNLKATHPNPILLHAGDIFVGDFMFNKFFGVPELQMMISLGFDALTLGNHEFDLYPPALKTTLQTAGFPGPFPVLSANLDLSGYPDLDPFIQDYTVKEYGNTKVGIFGLTTETTNIESNPAPVVVTSDSAAAVAMVNTLTAEGCDLIIALTHLGVLPEQKLAATIPGIDIIVGGHSHTLIPQPIAVQNMVTGDTTYVLQADWGGSHVGKMTLAVSGGSFNILDYQMIPIDDNVPEEPTTAATVASLIAAIEGDIRYGPVYSQVIAEAATLHGRKLGAGEYKDTKLGNLISDALRDTAKTDIAFAANGFIRQDIYPGDLLEADIFQVLPIGYGLITGYGSAVSTFEIDGYNIIAGLEFSVALIEYQETYFLQASGLTFDFNSNNQSGSRVDIASIRINDQPLDINKRYTVAINSDLIALLDFAGIDTVYNITEIANSEYAVVREYIKKYSPIDHLGGTRIRDLALTSIAKKYQLTEIPRKYFISQNYPNPFNALTTIRFGVPKFSNVEINIYNSVGQLVKRLVNADYQAGTHRIQWDGTNEVNESVGNGLYFVRLMTDDFYQTKKILLLK